MVYVIGQVTEGAANWIRTEAAKAGIDSEELLERLIGGAALYALQNGAHAGEWFKYIEGARSGGYIDVS